MAAQILQAGGEKYYLSFDIYYVNVHAIVKEESKIPQTALCLLLSILNEWVDGGDPHVAC